jgi:superfamily II DNA/RNA helicase
VLDEADEMLDMGFREDLEEILDATPAGRRTLLFSATHAEADRPRSPSGTSRMRCVSRPSVRPRAMATSPIRR